MTQRGVPILMYHSITAGSTPRFRRWTVTPAQFAAQMDYLHVYGFTPLTVSQFVAARRSASGSLPPRPVILTFDDGFADFYTTALPMLTARGFTATLYLTTGYIGGTSTWLAAEGEASRPMLDWGQVREVRARGIECGAHSHTHPALDTLPPDAMRHEIVHSRAVLEAQLGEAVTSFAYPFGYYSAATRRAAQAAGYTSACAVRYRPSPPDDDPFALSRLIVAATTTRDTFTGYLSGTEASLAPAVERPRAFGWRQVRRLRAAVHAVRTGRMPA